MPLLVRLDQKLDPTLPITPIPKGNQNDTVAQEGLQKSKQKYLIPSNWSLEQQAWNQLAVAI